MKRLVKVLYGGMLVLIAGGCATSPMKIAGLEFLNATGTPVSAVSLQVLDTYEVASCNYISAGGQFSTQFPLLDYRGNKIEVVWTDRAGLHYFGPAVIPALDPVPETPVMAVIVLNPAGRATAHFRVNHTTDVDARR